MLEACDDLSSHNQQRFRLQLHVLVRELSCTQFLRDVPVIKSQNYTCRR
jgi:hypothetical protein